MRCDCDKFAVCVWNFNWYEKGIVVVLVVIFVHKCLISEMIENCFVTLTFSVSFWNTYKVSIEISKVYLIGKLLDCI